MTDEKKGAEEDDADDEEEEEVGEEEEDDDPLTEEQLRAEAGITNEPLTQDEMIEAIVNGVEERLTGLSQSAGPMEKLGVKVQGFTRFVIKVAAAVLLLRLAGLLP